MVVGKGSNAWPGLHYKIAESSGLPQPKLGRHVNPWSATNIACVCSLIVLLLAAVTGSYLLWLTNFVDDSIHWSMRYSEGSPFVKEWKAPPFGPTTKLYIYNYTNAQDFMAGRAQRLKVKELGPYTFTETLEHVDVQFYPNDTMSYSEQRAFTFQPKMSEGAEDDLVQVPNLPLICAIARVRDEPYVNQLGLQSALWLSGAQVFNKLRVQDYLFGYNDTFYTMAKAAVEMATGGTLPKLGMLASRVGRSSNVYTVQTGRGNYSLQDRVALLNGRPSLSAWRDPECNRIDGSAGTFFPAEAVRRRAPLQLFNADICRRIPLEFKKEVTVMGDIPALRYGPPDDFLHNGEDNPDNACYKTDSYDRLPSGVFLNGPCFMDSPTFISLPRFFKGDPELMAEGMEPPTAEQHEMYFDIHPELGVNLGAATRFQVNVMVRKASVLAEYLGPLAEGMIIPILWFETVMEDFPEEVKKGTYHATFTVRTLESVARYGLPLVAVACIALLCHRLLGCVRRTSPPVLPARVPVQLVRLV